jgi:hypothetical protein
MSVPVRFVHKSVLMSLQRPEGVWIYDPAFLAQAATALGYVPWPFWQQPDCAGPCGILAVCPWCWHLGLIQFAGHAHADSAAWTYNGNPERPTLAPSVQRIPARSDGCTMHVWVRDGQIMDAGTPPHGG